MSSNSSDLKPHRSWADVCADADFKAAWAAFSKLDFQEKWIFVAKAVEWKIKAVRKLNRAGA